MTGHGTKFGHKKEEAEKQQVKSAGVTVGASQLGGWVLFLMDATKPSEAAGPFRAPARELCDGPVVGKPVRFTGPYALSENFRGRQSERHVIAFAIKVLLLICAATQAVIWGVIFSDPS
jgi:hypothetical protein